MRWLEKARRDLGDLFAFAAEDSVVMAEKELLRVFREASRLEGLPGIGRPGRVPETRELVVRPCVVAYRVKGGVIEILRVLHSTRKWPATI